MGEAYEPVRISSAEKVEEEREPLFFIDDQEFTIAKKLRPNVTIRYLQDTLDEGQEYALAAAMEEVLGRDAMAALADSDSVTEEHMQSIMRIVERKLQGSMRRNLGNGHSGRRR